MTDPNTPLDAMVFDDPDEELFFAIAWCDRPGVSGDFVGKIRHAHGRGAHLDQANEDGETPLTEAILGGMGAPSAVQVLLELGADAGLRAPSGWTPWAACQDRLEDRVVRDRMERIQSLLDASGVDRSVEAPSVAEPPESEKPSALAPADRPSKFASVYEQGTNGINCELMTDDLVAVLADWDERFGIEISEVGHDRLMVAFDRLPDDVDALAREIYAFCPDVIEQGFGCMDDMAEMFAESGQEMPAELRRLIAGIDFEDDDFGVELLKRDLAEKRSVGLWWD